jgi:putative lipoprotein
MKFAYMLSALAVAATLSACANNHSSNAANQAAPDPYGIASLSSSQQQPNVSGTINIRQRVALPPDAVLTVTLSDASRPMRQRTCCRKSGKDRREAGAV